MSPSIWTVWSREASWICYRWVARTSRDKESQKGSCSYPGCNPPLCPLLRNTSGCSIDGFETLHFERLETRSEYGRCLFWFVWMTSASLFTLLTLILTRSTGGCLSDYLSGCSCPLWSFISRTNNIVSPRTQGYRPTWTTSWPIRTALHTRIHCPAWSFCWRSSARCE